MVLLTLACKYIIAERINMSDRKKYICAQGSRSQNFLGGHDPDPPAASALGMLVSIFKCAYSAKTACHAPAYKMSADQYLPNPFGSEFPL